MSYANCVVVMAGGKGKRLGPLTKQLPKPLIPFEGKPIIVKVMENFEKSGFSTFILTLKYKKELIKSYFSQGAHSFNVAWVEEAKFLGSAGSLGLLREQINQTFFVCNCDTLIHHDFKKILSYHKKKKALATIVGSRNKYVFPYGVLEMNKGYLASIKEKPKFDLLINTGLYIFEPEVISLIQPVEFLDMDQLFKRIIKKGRIAVYSLDQGWIDLGDNIERARN